MFVYQFANFFQAKDLDDLIKAHSSYVEKLYDHCLLSQKVKWTYCIEGFELLNSHKWQRENFSQQYQYNVKQTGEENWEKYQLGDCWMIQYQILQNNMVRIVWHGESLMSSWEGKYKLSKCLPKKLTLKIISANVVLENLFVQLTKLLICFSVFILLFFFHLSGWLSAWSYSQGPQPSPVIPNILG